MMFHHARLSVPSADKPTKVCLSQYGYRSIVRGPAKRPHSGHSAGILVFPCNRIIALFYNLPTGFLAEQLQTLYWLQPVHCFDL